MSASFEWHRDDLKYALTLHRPWAAAVVHGPKRVENRSWVPHEAVRGRMFAIHAGAGRDLDMLKFLAERDSGDGLGGPFSPDFDERVLNRGIVGMARYVRAVRYGDAPSPEGQEFWFHGPFGWVLEDVYAFDVPIDVPGLQKLWHLHGTLRERVMMQARKAVGGGT